jgi:malonate transporter and related proteins
MTEILSLLLPVFAIIALGRVAVASGLLEPIAVKSLNDFALWVALPALLFRSLAEAASLQVIDIAAVYLAGCLIVYAGAGLVAWFFVSRRLGEVAVFALNATYGNIIYLGTPIIAAAFGPPGIALIVAIIALHSGILLPLTSVLFELSDREGGGLFSVLRRTGRNLLRNPILMSILLGAAWHALALPMPTGVHTFLSMLGVAASPLALFCVGASLPGFNQDSLAREAILPISIKLFVLPPVIAGLALAAGLSGLPLTVAVIAAAMPTGANAFLLSRRIAGFAHASASTVVVTTVVSVATLTTLLLWMR